MFQFISGSSWIRPCELCKIVLPDRPFHNFRASKSGDRQILCSSVTLFARFLSFSAKRIGRVKTYFFSSQVIFRFYIAITRTCLTKCVNVNYIHVRICVILRKFVYLVPFDHEIAETLLFLSTCVCAYVRVFVRTYRLIFLMQMCFSAWGKFQMFYSVPSRLTLSQFHSLDTHRSTFSNLVKFLCRQASCTNIAKRSVGFFVRVIFASGIF